jgi:hypothetical protein
MICNEYKCLFVHIPKTGGQSVEHVFVDLLGLSWKRRSKLLLLANKNPLKGPPRLAHLSAQEYLTHDYITSELFDSYFKFSFVRNPWDRLVSEYNYRYVNTYDFKTWLLREFPEPKDDCYKKSLGYYNHVIPQYDFLYDTDDNMLVDFIGKFENFQQDFDHVCSKINLPKTTLPFKNASLSSSKNSTKFTDRFLKSLRITKPQQNSSLKHNFDKKKYTEYYDDETKDFVSLKYQKDIDSFDYEFGS